MVCDTPPYGHAPKYQISLTYLERKPSMVWMFIEWFPTKLVLFQKRVFPYYIWILIMSPLRTKGDIYCFRLIFFLPLLLYSSFRVVIHLDDPPFGESNSPSPHSLKRFIQLCDTNQSKNRSAIFLLHLYCY
jgi:hypothetical protein